MNVGRAVLGVSTAAAIVAAAGLVVASQTSVPITGPNIGVCGAPETPGAFHTMAASFVIRNTSDEAVRILALRPTTLDHLASARVTIAHGASRGERSDYTVGATVGVPADAVASSSSVSTDHPFTLAAHAYATVITSMTLADAADAGRAAEYTVATEGPLGTVRTQTVDASLGLGRTAAACDALGGN